MLIVHLFVSYAHVNLCHFFSSSWCQGLAATSACGSYWTFLFTFLSSTVQDFEFVNRPSDLNYQPFTVLFNRIHANSTMSFLYKHQCMLHFAM